MDTDESMDTFQIYRTIYLRRSSVLALTPLIASVGCTAPRQLAHQPKMNVEAASAEELAQPSQTQVAIAEQNALVTPVSHMSGLVTEAYAPSLYRFNEQEKTLLDQEKFSSNAMTLADFEAIALANNPTLQQLAATTQKAAGYRTQVGLRSNPTIGYQAMQLADAGTDQHTAFIEQEIVTGNKLALNRQVLNEAVRVQLWELEAQKYRITTDIRTKFYEALAAQQRIRLVNEFQSVAQKGMELAEQRKIAMEGSQVDVLQAKIQVNEVQLSRQKAEVSFVSAWQSLVALSGAPQLQPTVLEGELPTNFEKTDWDNYRATILATSPEYMVAQTRVQQARANLLRQEVQATPNWTVQLAGGKDNGTNSGMMNLQVGAPIPVFNKNQGNIAAARAEYCRAVMEVQRVEKAIAARIAELSRDFDSALAAVNQYHVEILPSAKETLSLAEQAYTSGESGFLEVLTVRRTYFESNLQYLLAQEHLAQANARKEGLVLSGGLDPVNDQSGDDSLRGATFSQQ